MLEGAKLGLAMMAIALFVSVLSSAASSEEMPGGKEAMFKIKMTYANVVVTATLYDNATTRWLRNKLPLTIPMMNRYCRELVYRFPEALPTDNVSVRSYEVGEIVYYPPLHSFVILYAQNGEKFSMQRLGHIEAGLENFENADDISLTIEMLEGGS